MVGEIAHLAPTTARAEAFRRLADRHLEGSYRLARAIVGPADAEDATHDAFVTAWQNWSSLRDPDLFEHWFQRILINTCRNRLRRNRRHSVHDISDDLVAPGPDPLLQALDRRAVSAAFAQLSPDDRVIVSLRFYRDLTVEQIAHQLGVRPGTVKSRIHYALRRLQTILDDAHARGETR